MSQTIFYVEGTNTTDCSAVNVEACDNETGGLCGLGSGGVCVPVACRSFDPSSYITNGANLAGCTITAGSDSESSLQESGLLLLKTFFPSLVVIMGMLVALRVAVWGIGWVLYQFKGRK